MAARPLVAGLCTRSEQLRAHLTAAVACGAKTMSWCRRRSQHRIVLIEGDRAQSDRLVLDDITVQTGVARQSHREEIFAAKTVCARHQPVAIIPPDPIEERAGQRSRFANVAISATGAPRGAIVATRCKTASAAESGAS